MWASHNSWNHLVWHAKSRLYREALPAFQLPLPLSYTQVLTFSILQNSTTSIPPSLSCFWKWVAASKVTSTLTRNSNFLDLIESATSMLPFPENLTLLSGEGRPQESWLFNFVLVFRLVFFCFPLYILRTAMLETSAIKVTNLQLFNSGWIVRVRVSRQISTQ